MRHIFTNYSRAAVLFTIVTLGVFIPVRAQWQPAGATTGNIYYNNGNVGIGVQIPTNKLHINSGAIGGVFVQTDNEGPWAFQIRNITAPNAGLQIYQANNGSSYIWNNYPNGSLITLSGNGRIGVGTNDPKEKLHVAGNTFISNASIGRSGTHYDEFGYNLGFTGTNDQYLYRTSDFAASIRMGYNGTIEFRTASSGTAGNSLALIERMHISLSGNLGIGTNNPVAKLDINQSSNTEWAAQIYNSGGNGRGLRIQSASGNSIPILQTEDNFGNVRFIVQSNGNVLIGKSSQKNTTYKLDVDGKIHANEIVVNTDGADFVFEPTYNLRSLNELETYIKTNKHLPEIAPAKEMQENGVSAGELQTKLLQKVEELTLYILEQQKLIEKQDQRILQLETR